jgi:hypothetical protein
MSSIAEEVSRFNAENATSLTVDFLRRLGYKRGLRATKVTLSEGTYVVEMALEKRTAKVQIDSSTRQVKEYEIQDLEASSGFSSLKGKMVLILVSVIGVVFVVLKLLNVF